MGVCGNVCCIAVLLKIVLFSLGVLKNVVCLCSGCDGVQNMYVLALTETWLCCRCCSE